VNELVGQIINLVELESARANRDPKTIKIMVAAKYGQTEQIESIVNSGIGVVGENHVQNARRWLQTQRFFQLHMIGHLQTNKVKEALSIFDYIDTVDSTRLADEIEAKTERIVPCMIEVNISGEGQKSGVSLEDFDNLAGHMISLKNLKLTGVFTMAPVDSDDKTVQNVFLKADQLACSLEQKLGYSMERCYGMSDDFKVAIACGSTLLRLGRILFGGDKWA
jgi:pyridoxal phosphate enzyme (YggS family)